MAAEELVERVLAGDVHGESAAATAGAAPHLLEARDRARERDADRGVERADVDPELERVGRDDAEQLAGAQPPLDLLALGRRVAGAVGRDPLGQLRVEAIDGVAEDQLDALARLHEADRPGAARRSARRTPRPPRREPSHGGRAPRRAAAGSTSPPGARRAGAASLSTSWKSGNPVSFSRQLDRVRDRRAREQEPRRGAVDARRSAAPA